ncbi:MAG: Unknown protein [uncultured Sulfurovum sp.]|uniref:Uncharacterized protein n=1 Tax=uncultured Sulfurovum sp. TaxID=269237 RepID=A0A6S6TRC8_9BACT|nr:MAG: Unknown protein [uncultured Sulfurovum sp.]
MSSSSLSYILMTLLVFTIILGFFAILNIFFGHTVDKKKTELSNKAECKKVARAHKRRLRTDYFWSNHMRFTWITFFLLFFIALGFSIAHEVTILLSLMLAQITYYFFKFARRSYLEFPAKAAERLKKFETEIEAAVEAEICFDADNIQRFSSTDKEFDTKPELFSFPTNITKIQFPPYETRPPKQPIIATRKLEYLVLSREYFSICKGASTFNLLDPARAPVPKKCVELPGKAGECQEYYYSQIRNVFYDDADESIHITYNDDELEDIRFPCKKMAANRKDAMKALKGKLRLTERQKLRKIAEHDKYEKILSRRNSDEENKDDKPSK